MDNPVADPQRFTTDMTDGPRRTGIHIAGELDHDTTAQLQATLDQAPDGLNTLLRNRRGALDLHCSLILAAPGRAMVRLLRITGADAVLALAAPVPEALA